MGQWRGDLTEPLGTDGNVDGVDGDVVGGVGHLAATFAQVCYLLSVLLLSSELLPRAPLVATRV